MFTPSNQQLSQNGFLPYLMDGHMHWKRVTHDSEGAENGYLHYYPLNPGVFTLYTTGSDLGITDIETLQEAVALLP